MQPIFRCSFPDPSSGHSHDGHRASISHGRHDARQASMGIAPRQPEAEGGCGPDLRCSVRSRPFDRARAAGPATAGEKINHPLCNQRVKKYNHYNQLNRSSVKYIAMHSPITSRCLTSNQDPNCLSLSKTNTRNTTGARLHRTLTSSALHARVCRT